MNRETIQPGVIQITDAIVEVRRADLDHLADVAASTPRRRARYCAHRDPSTPIHEMIICLAASTYVQPHKHLDKSESFHVIKGECDLVILDDEGRIKHVVELGPLDSGRTFFYRLADPLFHTLLVRSDPFVIHETTNGPFVPEQTIFAGWAPRENSDGVAAYLQALEAAVSEWRRARA